jgi:hypothetical protein
MAAENPFDQFGPTVTEQVATTLSPVKDFGTKLFLYLPSSLVLFGFIADAIREEFRYSLGSIIGIVSVFVNSLVGFIIQKLVVSGSNEAAVFDIVGAKMCTVPGFESFESMFSPQGIVLPVSIFTYFFIDLGLNRPASENVGTALLFLGFLFIQLFIMYDKACFPIYYWSSSFVTIAVALLVGALSGVLGWAGVHSLAPQRLPSGSYIAPPASSSPAGGPSLGPGGTPSFSKSSTPGVGTCSAPNDQDQFVCETYKNGKLVTSS